MAAQVRERLLAMLESDLRVEGVARNARGTVNRMAYAARLGVTRNAVAYHDDVIAAFDLLGPKSEPMEHQLRGLLEADAVAGKIVTSSVNRINRTHYAKLLGGLQNTQYYRNLFEEYEARLGLDISVESRLRKVLEVDCAAGFPMLGERGDIHRGYYAKLLGITRSTVVRHTEIFKEFELRIGDVRSVVPARTNQGKLVAESRRIKSRTPRNDLDKDPIPLVPRDLADNTASLDSTADIIAHFPSLAIHQNYKIGSARGNLVSALNECLRNKRVPRSSISDARISREHFIISLNVSSLIIGRLKDIFKDYESVLQFIEPLTMIPKRAKYGGQPEVLSNLDDTARKVITLHPSLLKHQSYKNDSLSLKIVQKLNNQLISGGVIRSKKGKIARSMLLKQIGHAAGSAIHYKAIFDDYEEAIGGVAFVVDAKVPAIRTWLERQLREGSLEIWNGKVSRRQLAHRFELPLGSSVFRRYPMLGSLIKEFDAIVEREGYLPLGRREDLNRLHMALAGQLVLNQDRMTINQVVLAAQVGVPQTRFRDELFAKAIRAREAEILLGVKASKIDPFLHGRVFQFSSLAHLWPVPFLERVGIRFKQIAAGLAPRGVKGPYLHLVKMLNWIAESSNPHCRRVVNEAKTHSRILSAGEWEDALFAYRDSLVGEIAAGVSTEGRVDGAIRALRTSLDGLSSAKVTPDTSIPLPGIRNVRRLSAHLRSVAEVGCVGYGNKADYVAFASERFAEACKGFGSSIGRGSSIQFIEGISAELDALHQLPKDPVAAIRLVLERRLDALRVRAWAIVEAGMFLYQRGRELLLSAGIDGRGFEEAYFGSHLNIFQRKQLLREFFPSPIGSNDEQLEKGIANFLGLITQRYGGLPPLSVSSASSGSAFFAKRYLEYGGLKNIAPMLHPVPETVGAVLTLYLLGGGANLGVGRTLDRNCLGASDRDGYRRVIGHKARAKGKPILVEFPAHSQAVRAIEWLSSASESLRAAASSADRTQLFLMRIGHRTQLMTPFWYTNWFKRFVASVPGMEEIGLVPNMIRPSVLLHAAFSNDGKLAVGMAIGQHRSAITQGYQQKWPTRYLYDKNIMRFQEAFESLVMASVDDAASKLGITNEQFEARLGDLGTTGLGTFCKDQRGRPGERSESCSTVDCWNDCPHLLIVAEVEAMAALQLWQKSLLAVQPEWERDRLERWNEVWLPWLCLTVVVEEKMVRGPMIKIWKAAQRRAKEILEQRGYVPPRPW